MDRTPVDGLNYSVTLLFEPIDFIQAVAPSAEEYPNFMVALPSVWNKALIHHFLRRCAESQIELTVTLDRATLVSYTSANAAIQTSIDLRDIYQFSISRECSIRIPISEVFLVVEIASKIKGILQFRFGLIGAPVVMEIVSVGGCLSRFIVSCIEGGADNTILRRTRKKKQAAEDFAYEAPSELEEMLLSENIYY